MRVHVLMYVNLLIFLAKKKRHQQFFFDELFKFKTQKDCVNFVTKKQKFEN